MSVAHTIPAQTPLPREIEALYTEHYDFLWRSAQRLGVSPADVEDVIHETFVVVLRRYDAAGFVGTDAARPSTWLFTILYNVLRNRVRSEQRGRARIELLARADAGSSGAGAGSSGAFGRAETSLGMRLLDEFLAELEPDRRAVFVLAELEGMRGPEIARALGTNANTIRSRLRAARQAFELRFGDAGERLVDQAARVEAPPEARARGLALLGLPLSSIAAPTSAKLGTLGWWLSGRGLSLVVGGLALVGVAIVAAGSMRRDAPATASPTVTVEAEPAASVTPIASQADEPEPILVKALPQPKSEHRRVASASRSEPVTDPELAARERLGRARRALLDGDAATTLALVEAEHEWPASLDAHRVALEIGALCTLDRPQQARARAEAWQRAQGDGNGAIALRAVCWDAAITPVDGAH